MSKKTLIVADCVLNNDFLYEIELASQRKVRIIFIASGHWVGKKKIWRHMTYFYLAMKALYLGNKYDVIIFWQQFIGIYFGILTRLMPFGRADCECAVFPLIYKGKNRFKRLLFSWGLSVASIRHIIVCSNFEIEIYKSLFPSVKDKLSSVKYGIQPSNYIEDCLQNNISSNKKYFFSGGTSNRDYVLLIKAAECLPHINFVFACTEKDIAKIDIPGNVVVVHDAYQEAFEDLILKSICVIIPLKEDNLSSGQIVLLKTMQAGKPIIIAGAKGITEYINEDEAFLYEIGDVYGLKNKIEQVYNNTSEASEKAKRARELFWDSYTMKSFTKDIITQIYNNENAIRSKSDSF